MASLQIGSCHVDSNRNLNAVRRVSDTRLPALSRLLRKQEGLDEVVDVAAEHGIDITSFQLRARVFYQLIGCEHVASDLRSERDVSLVGFEFGGVGFSFFQFQFVKRERRTCIATARF